MRSHPRFATARKEKAPSNKSKGGGAPKGASNHCPRRTSERYRLNVHRRQVYAVCANLSAARTRALYLLPSPLAGEVWQGHARLPALHRDTRQVFRPGSAPGRVSWKNRVRTGLSALLDPSAAGTPHAGHSAGRAVARSRPGTVCETARGHRTRSAFGIASRKRPSTRAIMPDLTNFSDCIILPP
jgi:hypothetical protein